MDRDEFQIFAFVAAVGAALLLGFLSHLFGKLGPGRARVPRILLGFSILGVLFAAPLALLLDGRHNRMDFPAWTARHFGLPGLEVPGARWDHRMVDFCGTEHGRSRSALRRLRMELPYINGKLGADARAELPQRVVGYVAEYHGVRPADIEIAPGALDWRTPASSDYDPDVLVTPQHYQLQRSPSICAAIDRTGDTVRLRRCNPLRAKDDGGNAGHILAVDEHVFRQLRLSLVNEQPPPWCEYPVRRAVNAALGLPHPD